MPAKIGDYRIVSVLGRGGMGTVYEAEQISPRRAVALKVIRGGRYVDEYHLRLFQREAQTLARLKHPAIAAIYESGRTEEGEHFFAMELVRGVTLKEYVYNVNPERSVRLGLFRQICDAINYAHQRAVIHRDLKPSNILIDTEGRSKVLDFGLARITESDVAATTLVTEAGHIQGTLAYMSPEQARGNPDEIDLRSDVYSLGVILFELLTGQFPYDVGHSALLETVRVICETPPRRPSQIDRRLRGDLETIMLKALAKEPSRRYQSAAALMDDIDRYLTSQPILARPPSPFYQLRTLGGRHKLPFAFINVLFVLVVVFGVWMRVLYRSEREARQFAAQEARTAKWVKDFMVGLFSTSDPNEARGNSVTARELLDKGAERIRSELEAVPATQAELMDTIGTAYRTLGLYDDAAELLQEALQIRRTFFGDTHVSVAESLHNVGWALKQKGDLINAEIFFRNALALNRKILGDDHHKVIRNLLLLGATLRDQGRYAAAEPVIREALATQRSQVTQYGVKGYDENVSETLETLGTILYERGDYADAESSMRQALLMRRELLGPDHPHVASGLGRLARILQARGDFIGAEACLEEAMAIRLKSHGEDHEYVASLLLRRGSLLRDQGHTAEAEKNLRKALAIYRDQLSPDHPRLAFGMTQLGWVCFDKKDYAEAESLFAKALAAYRKRLHEKHPKVGEAMLGLARTALARGDPDNAMEHLRKVASIYRAAFPADHWSTATADSVLGECFAAIGRYDEAERLVRQSYAVLRQIRGPTNRYVLAALDRIIHLYEAWGKPDEAAKHRALHARSADGLQP